MAKMTNEDRIADFESMTVLELSEFVKMFEEHFGVTAAAPMAIAVAGGDGGGAVEEEKDEFDVVLIAAATRRSR